MTLEACDVFGWPYAGIGRRLRKHPEKVRQLHRFRQALETITATNLNVVTITATSVLRAAELSLQHGLLNNDALILAVMESEGLAQVASTDSDFDRVPGIVRIVPG
jgi:predicted nucleic acid-binding protein